MASKYKKLMIETVRQEAKPVSNATLQMIMYGSVSKRNRVLVDNWGSTLCNRANYEDGDYPKLLKRFLQKGEYWYTYYGET